MAIRWMARADGRAQLPHASHQLHTINKLSPLIPAICSFACFFGILATFWGKGGTPPILWWYRIHQSRYRNPCMFGKWFDSIVQYNTVQKILAVFFCTVFYCSFTCQTCRDFSEHLGKYLGLRARVKCVTPFHVRRQIMNKKWRNE